MKAFIALLVLGIVTPAGAPAQEARREIPPAAVQIAAAVAPLPAEYRATAVVLGYREGATGLVRLREGEGSFVCLADDPSDDRFHVACYHRSLEDFMQRGRELRAQGWSPEQADSLRNAAIEEGTLFIPDHPTTLYSLTGEMDALDPATGEVTAARPLSVIYVPFATGESTGLPTRPSGNLPWLMAPGTAKAHIMFTPTM